MEIIQKQLVFFFANKFEGIFEDFALKVKTKLGNADTQYLPIPDSAPIEIPRLIISYKEKGLNLNFSRTRVDIFLQEINTTNDTLINLLLDILNDYKIIINRVGFIQKSFLEASIEKINGLIVEAKRQSNVTEINIRINVPGKIGDYECNNIESINYVAVEKMEESRVINKKGILVEKDINTLLEKNSEYIFTRVNLSKFIKELNDTAQVSSLIKE